MTGNPIPREQLTNFRIALVLAVLADALQFVLMPLLIEGAESPADDILEVGIAAALFFLLGWHWEFLPSIAVKLVPGADMVPLWTLAVANVYRKTKRLAAAQSPPSQDVPTP